MAKAGIPLGPIGPPLARGSLGEDPLEAVGSELIATLNEKFGLTLNDADKVWFEQQRQAVKDDDRLRVVALNNDRDQYNLVFENAAENMIIDRNEANGQLFNAFFEKPRFRELLLNYLAGSYDEIRDEDAS